MSTLRTWCTFKLPGRFTATRLISSAHSVSVNNILACVKIPKHFCAESERIQRHSKPGNMAESTESPAVMNGSSASVGPDYCEIIVVRHGETPWNVQGKVQGQLDVELNEVGREQAVSVAERLAKEFKISVIYSSDLKRALETAQTIANRCGGLKVIEDPELRERHLGDLQGLVFREAAKVCPIAYQAFLSGKTDQDIPGGGESLDQLYRRCTSALQRIARKHIGERIVVVTHGGVIRTLYQRACPNKKPEGKVLNTSINIFRLTEKNKWVLKTWGDVSHLNQTGFLKSGFGGDSTSG
ncbi:phosphoglycerate mutase-like protein 4 [Citrus sinensis]|uniref:Phosphoglycerate mutase-like protein 4 n=1 Tax=Citrus clementina TaxID=85681 RepID=V4RW71_CITCL|nr:phosphoglycerate mutase-like protein 4 isoform X1 [Citrus x clementina]XP_006466640.3 phosphoglycerate mutase-like protein 4 isoform X1 [Citrus sinensis]ESR39083.1 hypothetical protein CICLE_v10026175mg [Citrus x clementina]KAH9663462.1 phosphoglycerate mutase-like protein 4 [Citrus sinensis]